MFIVMTNQELRQKYPKFMYEKCEYEFRNNQLEIKFYYSIPPDHKFVHHIQIQDSRFKIHESIENLIFNLGLSLIPSYWKTTCSPVIQLSTVHSQLSTKQLEFWHKLFLKGMGEYFYKNNIDFIGKDFLTINSLNTPPHPSPKLGEGVRGRSNNKVLVPVGGGKDSIVTLELLKSHYQIIPFIINPVPVMIEVCKIANLQPVIVTSVLDPHLLEMNSQGYLNGHVPVSAFYAFCAVLTAHLLNIPYIAFSNERSSDEGNTEYLGHTINHQYGKTLEFESDLKSDIKCFSFLRPLYELQITKIFSNYPQYFKVFSSCNQNFKLNTDQNNLWCGKCPKCVSTAMTLACFIGKAKVTDIMGVYPPDLPINQSLINELTGASPTKPFECVLTRAEAQAALTGKDLDKILSSWQSNPNMPVDFEKILREAMT